MSVSSTSERGIRFGVITTLSRKEIVGRSTPAFSEKKIVPPEVMLILDSYTMVCYGRELRGAISHKYLYHLKAGELTNDLSNPNLYL